MPKVDKNLVVLGETNFRNQRWRFGIKEDDRRRHMYVVGSTGMGKSEFLKNMAIQDIEAGRGVAFIDPHGDPSDDLLDHIPEERIKDVIYLDPGDLEFPIAFNVMEGVGFDYRHLVASGLVGVFKKIWGVEAWSGRMEYILNNTILALLEYPDSTLLGINRLMASKEYRKEVVSRITDPIVKAFWVDEFAKYADRFATEATAAIQNKVGQFASNSLIRNIIGQPKSKIDIRKIMDEGKILIANVSRGRIGEDASRLLGAFLVTKIQLAAMSRVDIPESERRDFYLYVDEFQHFATESFANILSEARKFHLSLTMAHQYIKQMEEPVRDAVFGNVGTIVSFRVGAEDGEFLEKWFQPDFMMNDIVNLGKYNVYLKLMIDGVSSRGFSATMIPPFPKLKNSNREAIIEYSRKTYATPRAEVEKNIAEWAGTVPTQEKPRDNRQSAESDRRPQFQQRQEFQRPAPQQNHGQYRNENAPSRHNPTYERPMQPQNRPQQQPYQQQPQQPRFEPRVDNRPRQEEAYAKPAIKPVNVNTQPDKPNPIKIPITSTNKPAPRPVQEPPRAVKPEEPVPVKSGGVSLEEAFKSGPVNFRGKRLDDKREKQKVEVDLGELKKALDEAMNSSDGK